MVHERSKACCVVVYRVVSIQINHREAVIASLIANKTLAAKNRGGSPIAWMKANKATIHYWKFPPNQDNWELRSYMILAVQCVPWMSRWLSCWEHPLASTHSFPWVCRRTLEVCRPPGHWSAYGLGLFHCHPEVHAPPEWTNPALEQTHLRGIAHAAAKPCIRCCINMMW